MEFSNVGASPIYGINIPINNSIGLKYLTHLGIFMHISINGRFSNTITQFWSCQ